MRAPIRTRALAAGFGLPILLLAQASLAQMDVAPVLSTKDGVYTAAQAGRGEELYMNMCVSCHPVAMHMGPAFAVRWTGRQLSELYDAIKDKMPKNDPGSLTPEESARLVAYMLKLNDLAAGKTELEADADRLKKIRIELTIK